MKTLRILTGLSLLSIASSAFATGSPVKPGWRGGTITRDYYGHWMGREHWERENRTVVMARLHETPTHLTLDVLHHPDFPKPLTFVKFDGPEPGASVRGQQTGPGGEKLGFIDVSFQPSGEASLYLRRANSVDSPYKTWGGKLTPPLDSMEQERWKAWEEASLAAQTHP